MACFENDIDFTEFIKIFASLHHVYYIMKKATFLIKLRFSFSAVYVQCSAVQVRVHIKTL